MTADTNLIQINLGHENDDHLFENLKKVLIDLKVDFSENPIEKISTHDLQIWEININNEILMIELETYIGLSISGSPKLVAFISDQFKKMKI